MSRINISGQKIGKLLVMKKHDIFKYKDGKPMSIYMCQCDCGVLVSRTTKQLRNLKLPSCKKCKTRGVS